MDSFLGVAIFETPCLPVVLVIVSFSRHMHRFPTDQRMFSWKSGLLVGMILLAACRKPQEPTESPASSLASFSLRSDLPEARPNRFVGSDSCRECHAVINDLFATHPMGRSIGTPTEVETIETYPSGPIEVGGQRLYRVESQDGRITHHEYAVDQDGEVVFDQSEPIYCAVGSGQRGRAYLIFKDGIFRQSPIGWYSTEDRWDLSPGYTPEKHQRFQRRIGDGCLYCHAGQVDSIGNDLYADRPFIEATISCERCHGPGEDHIAFHRAGNRNDRSLDPIVNPAKLSASARESVCNQCHLQGRYTIPRYGRSFHDFRPGDEMEDIFVCLISPPSPGQSETARVVSQVEQMRSSQCYIRSNAQLGCTSCHDPHVPAPSVNRDQYYADRCNACHTDRACSLPLIDQQAAPADGSCIHCHVPANKETNVPHTAQTDHRILRRTLTERSRPVASPSRVDPDISLQVFGNADRIPAWEQSRAIGIAMMTKAWQSEDQSLARQAITKLVPATTIQAGPEAVVAALTPDLPAIHEAASFYWLTENPAAAMECWSHILSQNPHDESALYGMSLATYRQGNATESLNRVDQALAINPESPQFLNQKVKLLWQLQRPEEAFSAAEQLLRLDPTLIELRQWLASSYRERGALQAAIKHEETLSRLAR